MKLICYIKKKKSQSPTFPTVNTVNLPAMNKRNYQEIYKPRERKNRPGNYSFVQFWLECAAVEDG